MGAKQTYKYVFDENNKLISIDDVSLDMMKNTISLALHIKW